MNNCIDTLKITPTHHVIRDKVNYIEVFSSAQNHFTVKSPF